MSFLLLETQAAIAYFPNAISLFLGDALQDCVDDDLLYFDNRTAVSL